MNTHQLLADTASQNRFDHYLYQNSLFFVVLFVGTIVGLGLGWILWLRCRNQVMEVERKNADLLDQASRRPS
jgi:hypothetical protein